MTLKMVAIRSRNVDGVLVIEKLVQSPRGTRVIDGVIKLDVKNVSQAERITKIDEALREWYPAPGIE